MEKITGRAEEQKILEKIYQSKVSEFVAIYGRRRIGKTFLVDNFFSAKTDCLFFRVTGLKDGLMHEQIENFTRSLEESFYENKLRLKESEDWNKAFGVLTNIIKQQATQQRVVIFFDELPWFATKKSRFLQNLDYFWNHHWSRMDNVKLIVCGSAASWMINNLIRSKGGLHNRTTARIVLYPFNLHETKKFLKSIGVNYTDQQILDLYIAIGGVPYYLKMLDKALSVTANLNALCFKRKGALVDEFNELYSSLFSNHEAYEELIRTIAAKKAGMERKEILEKVKLSTDGGTFNERMKALEEAGFIASFKAYGRKKRGVCYRVIDEYSLFYLSWIEPVLFTLQKMDNLKGYWQEQSLLSDWKSWAGYAFESVCYKHISQIRNALNISATAKTGSWQFISAKGSKEEGAQIDLLFDRNDKVITLCEIKYNEKPYMLNKKEAQNLLRKIEVFRKKTKTTKQLVSVIIASGGLKKTMYSEELILAVVTLGCLFKE